MEPLKTSQKLLHPYAFAFAERIRSCQYGFEHVKEVTKLHSLRFMSHAGSSPNICSMRFGVWQTLQWAFSLSKCP